MKPLKRFEKVDEVITTGPASYTTGGFQVAFPNLRALKAVVVSELGGGEYLPKVASVSGNTATILVRGNIEQAVNEGGSSTYTIGAEVAATTNLSGVTFHLIGVGD